MEYLAQVAQQMLFIREFLIDSFSRYSGFVKLFSLLISGILLFLIIVLMLRLNFVSMHVERFVDFIGSGNLSKRRTVKAWKQIQKRLQSGSEPNLKIAIIESDGILDEILKVAGYQGKTMGDRLKQLSKAQLSNIDYVWQVHQMRNRIVHEPDFHLTFADAQKAVAIYAQAFREFGLIE